MALPASRPFYLLAVIFCTTLMVIALYMEHVLGLVPCPLCIIQRVLVILVGLIALIAVLHNPLPKLAEGRRPAARVYAFVLTLFSVLGAAVAGRQVWLQHQPADQLPSCLPSLDYMVDVLPLQEILGLLFSGTADCAKVDWTFLGLSIAEGTLLAFIGLSLFGLVQLFRSTD
ncbi:disulfide bond formation protein B [Halopseudomonas pelagia]|uniref:Disulfide bond formation protein B n=1 Tax=Halopseudomonas pelagia TaxID=553151 RepID=A0AA91U433_9GAMM|nr:disulfide bond formation protein B [Halopseudomonas pelagia]PCD00094.1 disulfide bond formation protein B [Halopseudomonas pelagia]QFY58553.1 disulfide bond formation protein B [Halopseudomonas pelagia]